MAADAGGNVVQKGIYAVDELRPSGAEATGSTRTVDRALRLLSEVCSGENLTLADCARRSGLAASTALRLLRTLSASGFVTRADDGTFAPGPQLVRLGSLAFGRERLVADAQPSMRRIVAACFETTYLSIPGRAGEAIYIGMVEGTYSVRHTGWLSRTVPLEGTALGAVFGGRLGARGFVAMRSIVEADVSAVAAPIRRMGADGTPTTVAAISVIGPTYRLNEQRLEAVGGVLVAEADQLSARYGAQALGELDDESQLTGSE